MSLRKYSQLVTVVAKNQNAFGFAGIRGLQEPQDWKSLAKEAVEKCNGLVNDVVLRTPSAETVQLLDDVSDVLCQILDAAEFCRNVHSSSNWRAAAESVCVELGNYVHELNAHFPLYTALKKALDGAQTGSEKGDWDTETTLVAQMLLRDFERYGVHLEGPSRDRMAILVAETQTIGFKFTRNTMDPSQCGRLEVSGTAAQAVSHLHPTIQRAFRPWKPPDFSDGRIRGLVAPGLSSTLHAIMAQSGEEALRKAAYEVYHREPSSNAMVLDQLMAARHEMAAIMGFPSYAAYQLHDFSLAGTPAAVNEFLERLSIAVHPHAQAEAAALATAKKSWVGKYSASTNSTDLRPWDREWALAVATDRHLEQLAALSRYFTLDGCIAGMSALLETLMGVRLRRVEANKGEVWAPGVRKYAVEDCGVGSENDFLGTIYLDAVRRPHKYPGAAHFTLRCGRQRSLGASANEEYQTPIVAVVTNFSDDTGARMVYGELETLFHEFGHAMNSILSKTRFQHLSGTRGPQDIIELPSHVFERFVADPTALQILAHHSGHEPNSIQAALLKAAVGHKRQFPGLFLQANIALSAVDQLLHGGTPPSGGEAQRKISELFARHNALGHVPGAQPQLRFTHIIGYGATYYCYLYAQCLAAKVWEQENGSAPAPKWPSGVLLRKQLLEPGGSKPAENYVIDLFRDSKDGALVSWSPSELKANMHHGSGSEHTRVGFYPEFESLLRSLGIQ